MGRISRRMFVLMAGGTAIAGELLFPEKARAYYGVKNASEVKQCLAGDGKVTYFEEPKNDFVGYCDTADDLACIERLDNKKAYHDADLDECVIQGEEEEMVDPCFLTTACVGHIGLRDDCFELSVLRRFRDNVLAKRPGGQADIARYYDEAPRLVRMINGRPDGGAQLARAYLLYVLPSALFARLGLNRLAYRTYRAMMDDLTRRLA